MINFYDAAECFTVIVYRGASTRNFLILEIICGEGGGWKCKEYLGGIYERIFRFGRLK